MSVCVCLVKLKMNICILYYIYIAIKPRKNRTWNSGFPLLFHSRLSEVAKKKRSKKRARENERAAYIFHSYKFQLRKKQIKKVKTKWENCR